MFIVARLLQHDKVLNRYFDEYKENTFDIFLVDKLKIFLKEHKMNRIVSEKDQERLSRVDKKIENEIIEKVKFCYHHFLLGKRSSEKKQHSAIQRHRSAEDGMLSLLPKSIHDLQNDLSCLEHAIRSDREEIHPDVHR